MASMTIIDISFHFLGGAVECHPASAQNKKDLSQEA
jgi:hypothetical protein